MFAGAKQVRHDTNIGTQAVSPALRRQNRDANFYDPVSLTLLIVASGEMNRLVATHIRALNGFDSTFDRQRLLELARAHIEVHPLDALPELLVQADIVSSCSGSMHALIDKMVKSALKNDAIDLC